jgi:hypothetical protein
MIEFRERLLKKKPFPPDVLAGALPAGSDIKPAQEPESISGPDGQKDA